MTVAILAGLGIPYACQALAVAECTDGAKVALLKQKLLDLGYQLLEVPGVMSSVDGVLQLEGGFSERNCSANVLTRNRGKRLVIYRVYRGSGPNGVYIGVDAAAS